jgi:ABC-type transport system involved in multi-copper enzyme maturation permease subunit
MAADLLLRDRMLRDVVVAEALALRKRPAAWVLLGVWLAMTTLFGYLLPYLAARNPSSGGGFDDELSPEQLLASTLPPQLVPTVTGGMPLFGGALALVLGALVAGSPYGWGTLKTAVTQRGARAQLLLGTSALLSVVLLAVVVATFALGVAASSTVATVEDRPFAWPAASDVAVGIGAGWLIVAAWCALGVLLATVSRTTSLSIGLGLVWALVLENLVRALAGSLGWLDAVSKGLPGVNAGSLVASLLPGGVVADTPGVSAVVSGGTAAAVLAAYVVVPPAVAAVVLQRRDIS